MVHVFALNIFLSILNPNLAINIFLLLLILLILLLLITHTSLLITNTSGVLPYFRE